MTSIIRIVTMTTPTTTSLILTAMAPTLMEPTVVSMGVMPVVSMAITQMKTSLMNGITPLTMTQFLSVVISAVIHLQPQNISVAKPSRSMS